MSHLVQSKVLIKDIDALRRAAASFGAQFAEKKTFHSYQGETACDYVIALPTVKYEVGIVKQKDGSFLLSHDPFGYDESHEHDGHRLVKKFGANLGLLSQAYSRAIVMKQASAKGWMVQTKTLPDGRIRMQLINT